MSLDSLVNIQINKQTATVTQLGFGTPMIMSAEADVDNKFTGTAKIYTSLEELGATGDNYATTEPTYKMAKMLFSQNPKVQQIVIGKRANYPLMTVNLTPIVKDSTAYTITINGEIFTFTSDATATNAEIVAGLLALINAGTQNVVASGATDLTVQKAATPGGVATAGKTFTITFDRSLWTAQNTTADPGIASDLTTIRTAMDGNDDWYMGFLDSFGKAEITAFASEIDALLKTYMCTTFDADVLTAATTDIGSVLQGTNSARGMLCWHEAPLDTDLGAAWAGLNLPKDPGSLTWMFKTPVGPSVSVLTPSEIAYLIAKSVNHYITVAGADMMQEGVTPSGEFFDVTRGLDFITQRMKERVFAALKEAEKVEYEDSGVAVIEAEVRSTLKLGVSKKIFAKSPAPTVTVPKVADVSSTDKGNRILPDVSFGATLSGAIHKVDKITGDVSL